MESAQRVTRGIEYPAENCDSYEEGMRHRVSGVFDVIIVAQGSRDFEGCYVPEGAMELGQRLHVVVTARHFEMGCYLASM